MNAKQRALGGLLPAALPPVRRALSSARMTPESGRKVWQAYADGREIILLNSGTAALSAALSEAVRRRNVIDAEAIVPAYACPDIISACERAAVRPRLVDVADNAWGFDEAGLNRALTPNVVAVVAINFLGIGDGVATILDKVHASEALLIQDSAQHLPRRHDAEWPGDYVVFSFGRGKPLNLLRGGALVGPEAKRESVSASLPPGPTSTGTVADKLFSTRLAGRLFNLMTSPTVYWWMSRAPGVGLGETRYKPLELIRELPFDTWGQAGAELEIYMSTPCYDSRRWIRAVEGWAGLGIQPLLESRGSLPGPELLRLPLLAPDLPSRDRLVAALNEQGLGASRMYAKALNRLPDIPAEVAAQGPFRNADVLADRLFTIPTHTLVTDEHVERASSIVGSVLTAAG